MPKTLLRPAVLALVAFIAIGAVAADKQPITHETLWMTRRVSAPSISPDGKWVVFSVTDPSYDEKEQTTDLWIAPSDGSAKPRKLTATKAGESDATWSARQPPHRLLREARRRRTESDLRSRSDRRRSPARHEPLHRRSRAEVQARRQRHRLHQRRVSRRRGRRGEQESWRRKKRTASSKFACTRPSRSGPGIAGWSRSSRTSSCSRSMPSRSRRTCWPERNSWPRRDSRERAAAARAAKRFAANGRRTVSGWSLPPPRDGIRPRTPRSRTTFIASARLAASRRKSPLQTGVTAARPSVPTARLFTRRSVRTTARPTTPSAWWRSNGRR